MSIPSLPELELAAKKIVWTARKEGNLKSVHSCFNRFFGSHCVNVVFRDRRFTPRLVRSTLEEQFQLDEGTLGDAEFKSAIKAATKAALVCCLFSAIERFALISCVE